MSEQVLIPPPEQCTVFIDFDGTMTTTDVLDAMIRAFAPAESWDYAETLWAQGRIGSFECLSVELSAVRITSLQMAAFLRQIRIDPGLKELFLFLDQHQVPVTILSDGLESMIRQILLNHAIRPVPMRANRAAHQGNILRLQCPWRSKICQSDAAHCKCNSLIQMQQDRTPIYIGDGRSDLCAAEMAPIRFAKNSLADLLSNSNVNYVPYSTLHDVQQVLMHSWVNCGVPCNSDGDQND